MSDLISRQAAIDILDAFQVKVENGEEFSYSWARMRMTELPSAQPELAQRCTDAISRQAAIDAIMGEPTDAHYPSWYAERIEQLPSFLDD